MACVEPGMERAANLEVESADTVLCLFGMIASGETLAFRRLFLVLNIGRMLRFALNGLVEKSRCMLMIFDTAYYECVD